MMGTGLGGRHHVASLRGAKAICRPPISPESIHPGGNVVVPASINGLYYHAQVQEVPTFVSDSGSNYYFRYKQFVPSNPLLTDCMQPTAKKNYELQLQILKTM